MGQRGDARQGRRQGRVRGEPVYHRYRASDAKYKGRPRTVVGAVGAVQCGANDEYHGVFSKGRPPRCG
uniref:Uncharacterized protein n=1 Tax=Knipowitschia caucasica TaxID=637954 RepID=A0AAV2JSV4_KNICA